MIKIKNNLVGKHTDRHVFPILRTNLIRIFTEICNLEICNFEPRRDAAAVNFYLKNKKGLNFFGKTIGFLDFNLRIFISGQLLSYYD